MPTTQSPFTETGITRAEELASAAILLGRVARSPFVGEEFGKGSSSVLAQQETEHVTEAAIALRRVARSPFARSPFASDHPEVPNLLTAANAGPTNPTATKGKR